MTKLRILSQEEIKNFDSPTEFDTKEKVLYFIVDHKIQASLDKIQSFNNKVAFILQYGYFWACRKFFLS